MTSSQTRRTRVLIVDDSAVVRKILSATISAEPSLEVVGTAPDAFVARDKILALRPDVITLDLEMPGMDGLTFLRKLMRYHPLPVVVISSAGPTSCAAALEALHFGAVDVLAKPAGPYSIGDLRFELGAKLLAAASSRVLPSFTDQASISPAKPLVQRLADARQVIAIGASTGGTSAIEQLITNLPADSPGIVITQHIPEVFSLAFAKRLDQLCPFEVSEARNGDAVVPGRVIIAPGNLHMLLRNSSAGYSIEVRDGPQVCYHRPSVDVLFASVAEAAGAHAVGVLLTGMGDRRCPGFAYHEAGRSGHACAGRGHMHRLRYAPRSAEDWRDGSRRSLVGYRRADRGSDCPEEASRTAEICRYLHIGANCMRGSILIVDDSAMMRKIVLRALTLAGLEFQTVHEAANGSDALQTLQETTVELIMCDINMPIMSGLEMLEKMRELKLASKVPVIMVTTESSVEQVRQAVALGASGYIRKPFTPDQVKQKVVPLLSV